MFLEIYLFAVERCWSDKVNGRPRLKNFMPLRMLEQKFLFIIILYQIWCVYGKGQEFKVTLKDG